MAPLPKIAMLEEEDIWVIKDKGLGPYLRGQVGWFLKACAERVS